MALSRFQTLGEKNLVQASYYPDRRAVAGKPIAGGFRFVLDGVQGDADFIAHMFKLNSLLAFKISKKHVYKPLSN